MNLATSDARVKVTLHTVNEPDDDLTDSETNQSTVQVHARGKTESFAHGGATAARQSPPNVGLLQKELASVEVREDRKYILNFFRLILKSKCNCILKIKINF